MYKLILTYERINFYFYLFKIMKKFEKIVCLLNRFKHYVIIVFYEIVFVIYFLKFILSSNILEL